MPDFREKPELTTKNVRSFVRKRGRHSLKTSNLGLGPRRRSDYGSQPLHAEVKHSSRPLRIASTALFAVLVFVLSGMGFMYYDLSNRVAKAELAVEEFVEDEPQDPIDDYSGRAVNIAIIGTDSRYGEGNDRYGAVEGDESMRSDVTIVAHISADRSRVELISIPRDTITTIPSCKLKSGGETYPQQGQFNWAMSVGSEDEAANLDAGIACLWRTTEALTGLDIDEYVMFDFAGFEKMIDALGGVKMCFEEDLYDEQAELDVKAGCQTLNGHDALAYARARKAVGDGSDISRIGRQQELMGRIFHTAKSKNIFTDFPKLYDFLSQTLASITTSSNLARINTSMGLAYSLSGLSGDGLQFVTMPFAEAPWDPNRVVPSWQAEQVWEALANDEPIPPGILVTDSRGNENVVEEKPSETDEFGNPIPQPTDQFGNPVTEETDQFGNPVSTSGQVNGGSNG
ncbi:MAG: LCP family protein [Actinomycetaceae bacterium]|nr:LCP family protein [Actinomycetaceae bacterium]